MTILIHMLTGIHNNNTIGVMLIPYKAKSMAIMLDMIIWKKEDNGLSFTYEVMVVLAPTNFKPLTNLEQYDGLTNPQKHSKDSELLHYSLMLRMLLYVMPFLLL